MVLDTHAWIWWVSDPDKLGTTARRKLAREKRIGVAAISCWELAMLADRGRIILDRSPLEWIDGSLEEFGIDLVPLTPAVAVRSTQLGKGFHGDPADRQIVATALLESAALVTMDERIHGFSPVKAVW